MDNSRRTKIMGEIGTQLFGVSVSIICLSPILVILLASFKNIGSYESFKFSLSDWTLLNYTKLLSGKSMVRWLENTLVVCFAVTIITVLIDMMAAFAFAKIKFKGREALFLMIISTMMLPFSITLVPTYLIAVKLGLTDSYAGLIIPALSGPFGVYILRQFILGIPDEMLEAAKMDGASGLRIFRSVILPMSVQPMAVLAIFTFVNNWNNFLWPLLIVQSDKMMTLTVGIATNNTQFSQSMGSVTASSMISLIPMVILFFFFQRFFLQGVTAGAIKE